VINEEMYEEEDDDLPSQYRRYAANFNTNSAEFNRKVQAYLTNHMAVNTAFSQAINGQPMTGQYNQQFPMNQPWAQQGMNPMQQQMWQQQQMQQQYNSQMIAQQMMHNANNNSNNNNFMQTPLPSQFQTPQQNFRPTMPQRKPTVQQSNNTAPASKHVSPVLNRNDDSRRMSAPIVPASSSISPRSQVQSGGLSNAQRTGSATSLPALPMQSTSILPTTEQSSPVQQQSMWGPNANMDLGPLTTSLPAETQMFLGANPGGFSMNNVPLNPLNMNSFFGSVAINEKSQQQPFYSYNPNNYNKGRNMHPSFDGMSQTLAPGALDNTADPINWTTPGSASTLSNESAATPFSSTFTPGFADPMMGNNDMFKLQQQYNMTSPMVQPSGFVTPGEAEWSAFIDSSNWDEVATTT